ncbi:MAG TPA: amino acid ABC transporter permease [Xanthobacteraceae bacterium]|nr:amino acid ABC transporter permease [Xanthobacteraceae bacterium]
MNHEFAIVWAHKDRLLVGFGNTIVLSLLATAAALALASPIAIALMAHQRTIRALARGLVDGMRCIPFLLLAYIVYYALPTLGIRFDNWTAGLCALVIYNAAYMAEILRGAWASLPREHIDAGLAFGFSGLKLYRRIVLPPIVLACMPVLGNQMIQIIKDSAFLTIIAVPELTHEASAIQSMYYVPFAAFVSAVALYWVLCRMVELVVAAIERRAWASR